MNALLAPFLIEKLNPAPIAANCRLDVFLGLRTGSAKSRNDTRGQLVHRWRTSVLGKEISHEADARW